MNKKNYWFINRKGSRALIICPICAEWYEIPYNVEELKCYRHCPWCGVPLFIKEEDKHGENRDSVYK